LTALVLGAGGQLGSDLMKVLADSIGFTRQELSVTDRDALLAAMETLRPEVVFNCAAYNAVDRAESEPQAAMAVNAEGAGNVAHVCRRLGCRLVHFSTNFVFDGSLDRPYVETDLPAPLSAYGRSKLEGERRTLTEHPGALVIRTAALYGDRGSAIKGGSFPQRIVERARRGETLKVVGDQMVNPTYTLDLARALVDLSDLPESGVVHLVSDGCCSWDEFARAALAACGVSAEVETVPSASFAAPASRPRNGCLSSERVRPLRGWEQAIREWAMSRPGPPGA
jgi:dTDP-4-dehydrorhamnose reductase